MGKRISSSPNLKVEMTARRAMGITGIPDRADYIALKHIIANRSISAIKMGISCLRPIWMFDDDVSAVTAIPANPDTVNNPFGGCKHGSTAGVRDIDAIIVVQSPPIPTLRRDHKITLQIGLIIQRIKNIS